MRRNILTAPHSYILACHNQVRGAFHCTPRAPISVSADTDSPLSVGRIRDESNHKQYGAIAQSQLPQQR